jgi:hypothetical protein
VSSTVSIDMRIGATLARVPPRVAFWALAGVALFLSHDAVFLVQVGPGDALTRALRDAGHDYWGAASLILALVGLAVGAAAVLRVCSLRRRVAQLQAPRSAPTTAIGSRFAAIWLRLFAAVALGFALQENVEHIISHGHAIGPGALLGPEYPLALPVIGLVTALAGFVAAAVRRTEGALLSIISAALQRPRGGRPRPRPRSQPVLARRSPLANAIAGRAPPRRYVSGY